MAAPERVEPGFDADAALPPLGPLPTPDGRPRLDALIDAIAPIALDGRWSRATPCWPHCRPRAAGSKPFAIEGLNEASGEWEAVAGQRYSAFQAGVQLANRTGALNEIEFSEFVMKASLCRCRGRRARVPRHAARGGARASSTSSPARDAQLGFMLRARRRLEPRLCAAAGGAPGLRAGAMPGAWCCPRPSPACRPAGA
jgi:hypothetical protein